MPSNITLLLVLLISLIASTGSCDATARSFFAPVVEGHRIAFCLQSSEQCGKPVADAWCRWQGFDQALLFERDLAAALHVLHTDTGKPCTDDMCISFRQIKCSCYYEKVVSSHIVWRRAAMDDSRPSFEEPTLDDVFEEPIMRLMMARDGVTRADLEVLIGRVRSIHPDLAGNTSARLERL
jgi:hypothetical protein